MKTILVMTALFFQSFAAHAYYADELNCKFQLKHQQQGPEATEPDITNSEQTFFAIRVPVAKNPYGKDVKVTSAGTMGKVSLNGPTRWVKYQHSLTYQHAVRVGADGKLEARQRTCLSGIIDFCDKGKCAQSTTGCVDDGIPPFENGSTWQPVAVIGGIPAFYEKQPIESSVDMLDKHGNYFSMKAQCTYRGSYQ